MARPASVETVLAGQASYDDLSDAEQAIVRAEWELRDTEAIRSLDFSENRPDPDPST